MPGFDPTTSGSVCERRTEKGIHLVMAPVPIVATHIFSRAAKLGISPLPRNLVVN